MSKNIKYTKYTVNGKEFDITTNKQTVIDYIMDLGIKMQEKDIIRVTRITFTKNCHECGRVVEQQPRVRHCNVGLWTDFGQWINDYPKEHKGR